MSDDNILTRARASLQEEGEHPKEDIAEIINAIEQKSARMAELTVERRKLKDESNELARDIEDGYARLLELVPANPLGTLQIGNG